MRGRGTKVKCYPGIKVNQLTEIIENMSQSSITKLAVFHVGTNDIEGSLSNDFIIGDLWNLIRTAQTRLPQARIIISAILQRNDRPTSLLNKEIKWMCDKSGAGFIDTNPFLSPRHFKRDGLHPTAEGAAIIGHVIKNLQAASETLN